MATLFNGDRLVALDSNGKVIAGAQLFFYQTGTTTLQTVYADSGATVALSNPVVADAGGLFPAIYLANVNAYKTVLQTSLGATVRTTDPVSGGAGASTTFTPQGRLTLASGSPIMTANQASAATIYYTPYNGNQIPIYDGTSAFGASTFPELSNSTTQSSVGNAGPAAVAANKNYDMFLWSSAGNATLTRGGAWNSDAVRSAATENDLQRINGILTNKNAITNGPAANKGTYVGTVRSDGSATINWVVGGIGANGTAGILGVWNAFNRVTASGLIGDSTDSWTYTTATLRAANASNTMRVSFVQGLQEDFFFGEYSAICTNGSSVNTVAAIGYDSTSVLSGLSIPSNPGNAVWGLPRGNFDAQGLGFHFMQALELSSAAGATTWYGDDGAPTQIQTGLRYSGRF